MYSFDLRKGYGFVVEDSENFVEQNFLGGCGWREKKTEYEKNLHSRRLKKKLFLVKFNFEFYFGIFAHSGEMVLQNFVAHCIVNDLFIGSFVDG